MNKRYHNRQHWCQWTNASTKCNHFRSVVTDWIIQLKLGLMKVLFNKSNGNHDIIIALVWALRCIKKISFLLSSLKFVYVRSIEWLDQPKASWCDHPRFHPPATKEKEKKRRKERAINECFHAQFVGLERLLPTSISCQLTWSSLRSDSINAFASAKSGETSA